MARRSLCDVQVPTLAVTGATGATAPSNYKGSTTGGPPVVGGPFAVGDWVITPSGVLVCVVAGTGPAPLGTWLPAGPGFVLASDQTTTSETRTGATTAVVLADPCTITFPCPSGAFLVEAWAFSGAVNAVDGRGQMSIQVNGNSVSPCPGTSRASGDIFPLFCRWKGTAAMLGINVGDNVVCDVLKKVFATANTFTIAATALSPIVIEARTDV